MLQVSDYRVPLTKMLGTNTAWWMLWFGSGDFWVCAMHLFACRCFIVIGADMGLPACFARAWLLHAALCRENERFGCFFAWNDWVCFSGKQGLGPPPFNTCVDSPLACACPWFVQWVRWPKYETKILSYWRGSNQLLNVCRSILCILLLITHNHSFLAATTALVLALYAAVWQKKQCTVLPGLFKIVKAQSVLQGRPVRKASQLEI